MSDSEAKSKKTPRKSWLPEEDTLLRQCLADSMTYEQAAAALGRSRYSVKSRVGTLGIDYVFGQARHATRAEGEKLAKYLRDGLTYQQISERTGLSRGCIAGWVHRVRRDGSVALPPRKASEEGGFSLKRKRQIERVERDKAQRARNRKRASKHPLYAQKFILPSTPISFNQEPRPEEPVSRRFTVEQLENNSCRYIHGDPKHEYHYCGHIARDGRSYCDFHHNLCYTTPGPMTVRGRIDVAYATRMRRFLR